MQLETEVTKAKMALKQAENACMVAITEFYNIIGIGDILFQNTNIASSHANKHERYPISNANLLNIRNPINIKNNKVKDATIGQNVAHLINILRTKVSHQNIDPAKLQIAEKKLIDSLNTLESNVYNYLSLISRDKDILNEYLINQTGLTRVIGNNAEAEFYKIKRNFEDYPHENITKLFSLFNNKRLLHGEQGCLLGIAAPMSTEIIAQHFEAIKHLYHHNILQPGKRLPHNLKHTLPSILYGNFYDLASKVQHTLPHLLPSTNNNILSSRNQLRWVSHTNKHENLYNTSHFRAKAIDYHNESYQPYTPFSWLKVGADSEVEGYNIYPVGTILRYGANIDGKVSHATPEEMEKYIAIAKTLQQPVYLQYDEGKPYLETGLTIDEINNLPFEKLKSILLERINSYVDNAVSREKNDIMEDAYTTSHIRNYNKKPNPALRSKL